MKSGLISRRTSSKCGERTRHRISFTLLQHRFEPHHHGRVCLRRCRQSNARYWSGRIFVATLPIRRGESFGEGQSRVAVGRVDLQLTEVDWLPAGVIPAGGCCHQLKTTQRRLPKGEGSDENTLPGWLNQRIRGGAKGKG